MTARGVAKAAGGVAKVTITGEVTDEDTLGHACEGRQPLKHVQTG